MGCKKARKAKMGTEKVVKTGKTIGKEKKEQLQQKQLQNCPHDHLILLWMSF